MGCSDCSGCKCAKEKPTTKISDKKIILAGNPNVGKSVIFGALTGIYAEVSNYPGTTVDVARAFTKHGEIIDTPGTYSLGTFSEDEKAAVDIIKDADLILNIVSAMSLERDLILTLQLIDAQLPMVLIVNQLDDAQKNGVNINFRKLETELGITVIPAVATKGVGLDEIKECLTTQDFKVSKKITPTVAEIFKENETTGKDCIKQLLQIECGTGEASSECEKIQSERIELINKIIQKVIRDKPAQKSFSEYFEIALFHPIFGTIIALIILFLLFEIIGVLVSGQIVDFVYGNLENHFCPMLREIVSTYIPNKLIAEILAGEFGIFTMAFSIIVGVLLPLITAFYLFMAFLEDSGYLPRLAVFCDSALSKIGLNGRAIIPLILGFGCTTMAVITLRILPTNKERMIASALLAISVPCAAQQGIIIALVAAMGSLKIWAIYLFTLFVVMALIGTVLNKLSKEQTSDLLLSLPALRFPQPKNILKKTFSRIVSFLKEASIFFAASSLIISMCNYFGILAKIEKALRPIVVNLLHLPESFSDVFVMGLIRRDMAAVGLFSMAEMKNSLSETQLLVAAVVITLFVPCIAMVVMMFKERGWREGTILWLSAFAISIGTGAILARILPFIL